MRYIKDVPHLAVPVNPMSVAASDLSAEDKVT